MSSSKGIYGKNTILKATLKDASGKAIANKKIKLVINKKIYTKLTNSKE